MMDVRCWVVIGMGPSIASCGRTSSVFVVGADDTGGSDGSTGEPDPSTSIGSITETSPQVFE